MRRILLAITLLSLTMTSQAEWFEVEGKAYVAHGDKSTARTLAIENALKKALLIAGASVSSVQQVVNGLITQDELSIRASGSVNFVEVLSESYADNEISVTIRADIFPQTSQCFASDYRKSILLTRAHINNREQANIGELYSLDTVVVNTLNKKIEKNSRYIDASLVTKNKSNFSRLNQSYANDQIKDLTIELGHMFDSQYILFTEINDVSFDSERLNSWQLWQDGKFNRHFAAHFYLYNSVNGELIFDKTYQAQAPWHYNKRKAVDLNSKTFWQGDYGRMIERLLNDAVIDIDESVMCNQSRAKIVEVSGNQIRINIGLAHGVQVGDELTLLHSSNFTSNKGKKYAGFNISPYKVKVSQVNQYNAIAIASNEKLLGNIQIDDLAVRD